MTESLLWYYYIQQRSCSVLLLTQGQMWAIQNDFTPLLRYFKGRKLGAIAIVTQLYSRKKLKHYVIYGMYALKGNINFMHAVYNTVFCIAILFLTETNLNKTVTPVIMELNSFLKV